MAVPSDYSGLILHLKGDVGLYTDAGVTPATVNGDLIYQWSDQSGAGNHATQTVSGNRPALETAGLNGINRVGFAAASSRFFNLPNLFTGLSAAEWFLVVKPGADPAAAALSSGLCKIGSDSNDTHYPWTDGLIYDAFGSTARKSWNPTPNLASVHRVYNVYSAAADWAAYIDNLLSFSTTTNTVGWFATPTLGKSNASAFLNGSIVEVVAYNRKLTAPERGAINDYLGVTRFALWAAGTARITQLAAEVIRQPNPNARITQVCLEVIRPNSAPAVGLGRVTIPGMIG